MSSSKPSSEVIRCVIHRCITSMLTFFIFTWNSSQNSISKQNHQLHASANRTVSSSGLEPLPNNMTRLGSNRGKYVLVKRIEGWAVLERPWRWRAKMSWCTSICLEAWQEMNYIHSLETVNKVSICWWGESQRKTRQQREKSSLISKEENKRQRKVQPSQYMKSCIRNISS